MKDDCGKMMNVVGIKMLEVYGLGMFNVNCLGCVKVISVIYWNLIRDILLDNFKCFFDMFRELGVKLVRWNGERMFLDELLEYVKGRLLKGMDLDCGFFCEEKWK